MACDNTSSNFSLSIVVPSYNEENNISVLYSSVKTSLENIYSSWEIIFCDDGSSDRTWNEVLKLNALDPRVKGIRLSRNFGHQYALLAGLYQANGDAIVTMDADLQHPPAVIQQLISEWQNGSKIVHTARLDDKSLPQLKKTTSKWFYKLFSLISSVPLKEGMADFRLLDRQVVKQLLLFHEPQLFFRGLVQWVGFPSTTIQYHSAARFSGHTKYTLRKMVQFALNGIISFSIIPLRLSILAGILMAIFAFLELLYVLYVKLFTSTAITGWASIIGVMSFLFSILFINLGILGEYIGQVLMAVRRRPRFLVSDQIGIDGGVKEDFS